MDYPRNRADLKRPEVADLKEKLISKLRKKVEK